MPKLLAMTVPNYTSKKAKFFQGLTENAISTVTVDSETLSQLIATGDANQAIEAFMLGKIRIDGDMSQIMTLQSAKPSQEQKSYLKKILQITEF